MSDDTYIYEPQRLILEKEECHGRIAHMQRRIERLRQRLEVEQARAVTIDAQLSRPLLVGLPGGAFDALTAQLDVRALCALTCVSRTLRATLGAAEFWRTRATLTLCAHGARAVCAAASPKEAYVRGVHLFCNRQPEAPRVTMSGDSTVICVQNSVERTIFSVCDGVRSIRVVTEFGDCSRNSDSVVSYGGCSRFPRPVFSNDGRWLCFALGRQGRIVAVHRYNETSRAYDLVNGLRCSGDLIENNNCERARLVVDDNGRVYLSPAVNATGFTWSRWHDGPLDVIVLDRLADRDVFGRDVCAVAPTGEYLLFVGPRNVYYVYFFAASSLHQLSELPRAAPAHGVYFSRDARHIELITYHVEDHANCRVTNTRIQLPALRDIPQHSLVSPTTLSARSCAIGRTECCYPGYAQAWFVCVRRVPKGDVMLRFLE